MRKIYKVQNVQIRLAYRHHPLEYERQSSHRHSRWTLYGNHASQQPHRHISMLIPTLILILILILNLTHSATSIQITTPTLIPIRTRIPTLHHRLRHHGYLLHHHRCHLLYQYPWIWRPRILLKSNRRPSCTHSHHHRQ